MPVVPASGEQPSDNNQHRSDNNQPTDDKAQNISHQTQQQHNQNLISKGPEQIIALRVMLARAVDFRKPIDKLALAY